MASSSRDTSLSVVRLSSGTAGAGDVHALDSPSDGGLDTTPAPACGGRLRTAARAAPACAKWLLAALVAALALVALIREAQARSRRLAERSLCASDDCADWLPVVGALASASAPVVDALGAHSSPLGGPGSAAGGIDCSSAAGIAAASEFVLALTRRRAAARPGVGGVFSIGEYLGAHACARVTPEGTRAGWHARAVAYGMMASSKLRQRVMAARATWLRTVSRDVVLVSSDAPDAVTGAVKLRLTGAGGAPIEDDGGYAAAQHRSLGALRHIVATMLPKGAAAASSAYGSSAPRWVALVDDDCFVNTANLAGTLAGLNADLPVVLAVQLSGTRWIRRPVALPGGGSGMFFSAPAARLVAAALYTDACPFEGFNDMTIGRCAESLGIPQVHAPGLEDYAVVEHWRESGITSAVMGVATIHRVRPRDMCQLWIALVASAGGGGVGDAEGSDCAALLALTRGAGPLNASTSLAGALAAPPAPPW